MELDVMYRYAFRAMDTILFSRIFALCERLGFHITRNHFYEPIPDTRTLKDQLWLRQSQLIGININEQKQVEMINQFLRFKNEYDNFPKNRTSKAWQFYANNPHFGPVDAEVLYCMIRHFQPKKIIEIGCGYSTYLSAEAVLKNKDENGFRADLIAVDPHPNGVLKSGFPGLSRLITKKIEDVDLEEYKALRENDILFIDSSHVLKIGNDVHHEYLEILPRLNKGVIVHIHDIFYPCEYPKMWVLKMRRFWNEQYLVQAFLAFNNAFEVLWCGSYMRLKHSDKLADAFASYNRATVWSTYRPGATSLWIRKIA
jgi:hypothetical protein